MSIRDVIANALVDLNENMPDVAQRVIKDGCFITAIQEESIPIKVNGIFQVPKNDMYVIVDFEKKITHDPIEFQNYSLQLYDMFMSVPQWYDC